MMPAQANHANVALLDEVADAKTECENTEKERVDVIAYHGKQSIKDALVIQFAAHRAADAVIQGTGYQNGRGCFVGCCLQNYDHSQFERMFGWPQWFSRLAETIFEGLLVENAPQFGTDLIAAVPVGFSWLGFREKFLVRLQHRNIARIKGDSPQEIRVRTAIGQVIDVLGSAELARSAAELARSAAAKSAADAAYSAGSAEFRLQSQDIFELLSG